MCRQELSSTADKEQEGYRSYLLHRMLPALERLLHRQHESPRGRPPERGSCALWRRASTARLEGCLAELHNRLLRVQTPLSSGASVFQECERVYQSMGPIENLHARLPYLFPSRARATDAGN